MTKHPLDPECFVFTGGDDQITSPKYSRFLAETIEGATMAIVPAAGHMVMLERPEVVGAVVDGFMARCDLICLPRQLSPTSSAAIRGAIARAARPR